MRLPLCLFAVALLSCNSSASATIQIITGEETDTFTQTPVPTTIQVQAVDTSGNVTTLATSPYPTDSIDLGNQDEDAVAALEVQALAGSTEVVFGASISLQYGALDGETLPIFVQRVGQNARLPNPPTDSRPSGLLSILSGRFLLFAGGTDSSTSLTTDVYDFAQFGLLTSPPSLPIVPTSMPLIGTVGLLLDANDSDATYYDFSQDEGQTLTAPEGYAFSDVAGGQTIYNPSGQYVFIVGATRTTGTATAAVLQIDTTDTSNSDYVTGNLSWLTLSSPRLGASAAWVPARGLVVAGGNATAAGVEIIAKGTSTGSGLAYPPDPSTGSGMTSLDGVQTVLVAGGVMPDGTDAGLRALNLGCSSSANCVPTPWGTGLPTPLTLCSAFTLNDAAHAFLVGNEPSTGTTHTFTLTSAGATEVPLKVAHTNASAILSPMGSSILIYGGANEIESFTPAPVP